MIDQSIVSRNARYAESIERNVPDQLLPVRAFEVVGDFTRDTGLLEQRRDVVCALLGRSEIFAEHNNAVCHVMNDSGRNTVEAHETKSAHDLFRRKQSGQLGRRSDNEMANKPEIKIISLKSKNGRRVSVDLDLDGKREVYDVSIVDQNGIFGLEMPDSLGLKLRKFPPAASRNLINAVKLKYTSKLRAA